MYPVKSLEPKPNRWDLAKKIIFDQSSALRLVYFLFIPGMIFPTLHISSTSAMTLMDNLHWLVFATIALLALGERDKLKKGKIRLWIHYVLILTIGVLTVEFIGLFVHSLASIFIEAGQLTPELEHWTIIATIFTGLGGITLSIIYYYSERIDRWIFSKVNPKYAVLGTASFAIIIASLSLWLNPQVQNFLNSFL